MSETHKAPPTCLESGRNRSPEFITLRVSKLGALALASIWILWVYLTSGSNPTIERVPPSSMNQAAPSTHLAEHCANIPPISGSEFHQRQSKLAHILHSLNASAYVMEPGANSQFFANISVSNWRLSERPFLVIVTPVTINETIQAKLHVLTPKFEATRAKLLPIPSDVQYIEWAEDEMPYKAVTSILSNSTQPIFTDSSIRQFLVDGLQQALPRAKVVSASSAITQIRERKSAAEIEILKCVNEATLLAIRDVHKLLNVGVRESEAGAMMASAFSAAGLKNGGCLTLFGENAALPHGAGTDRSLGRSEFALFDCTASLHGYYSDITRTVALPNSEIPAGHQKIWHDVQRAQTIALQTAQKGVIGRQVDAVSRHYLNSKGYSGFFTHRLGHGIGLEVHEHPYLHGASDAVITTGNTFSDEPGVYIEGKVGIRLEDCFFINEDGKAIYLTEGVGGQSLSPWDP